jgi:hypothetical protein
MVKKGGKITEKIAEKRGNIVLKQVHPRELSAR